MIICTREGDGMSRQKLVDQMVVCEEGIITVTMPLNCRTGKQSSFSFPGNEDAVIAVKGALYSFITTLYDDLFGRMQIPMELVPLDSTYQIRPKCMRFELYAEDDPKAWEDTMCKSFKGCDAICSDIDTFLGDNLIFNRNGECGASSNSKAD